MINIVIFDNSSITKLRLFVMKTTYHFTINSIYAIVSIQWPSASTCLYIIRQVCILIVQVDMILREKPDNLYLVK